MTLLIAHSLSIEVTAIDRPGNEVTRTKPRDTFLTGDVRDACPFEGSLSEGSPTEPTDQFFITNAHQPLDINP